MKPRIRKIFWLYAILFALLIGYLLKICLYDSNSFVANSFNPRVSKISEGIKRGSVLSYDGTVIAESVLQEDGTYTRRYNDDGVYSHIVGYDTKGKAGIESKYNFMLETVNAELVQRMGKLLFDDEVKGNSVVMTIDNGIQQLAAQQLGSRKGAIVAMEPSTGRILACVSYPTFDSNAVDEDWEYLNTDEENSPLLNRATQGLYPPGSIFKIITAAAALENDRGMKNFTMYCQGKKSFGINTINCFNGYAHGDEDMLSAFANSCNTYFATIGVDMGAEALNRTAAEFNFNNNLNFSLEYTNPVYNMHDDAITSEIMETAIGQGRTLVSPLYMAMVTSAIANNGMMMQPYIVDHALTAGGRQINKTMPVKLAQVCTPDIAGEITEFMKEVVNSGTAEDAAFSVSTGEDTVEYNESGQAVYTGSGYEAVQVAGKTGTAENSGGDDHCWFVAFAPADNPQIAVSVILENSGHGSGAINAARNIMQSYLENKE